MDAIGTDDLKPGGLRSNLVEALRLEFNICLSVLAAGDRYLPNSPSLVLCINDYWLFASFILQSKTINVYNSLSSYRNKAAKILLRELIAVEPFPAYLVLLDTNWQIKFQSV